MPITNASPAPTSTRSPRASTGSILQCPRRRCPEVQLQPVSDPRRGAAALPHGAAATLPAGARGGRRASCRSSRLRYVGLSHVEADECGSLNEWLAAAPRRAALRPGRGHGLDRRPGRPRRRARWPTARHSRWARTASAGSTRRICPTRGSAAFFEEHTRTLLCGDLFTQPGQRPPAADRGGHPRAKRGLPAAMDYFSHAPDARRPLERLAASPRTLACMHGSAWQGDGGALLRALAVSIER